MDNKHYDVLIIGGGMVGASLACALQGLPIRVGLIEAVPFRSASQPSYDDRSIALAYGTRRIFEGMGLWSAMALDATPIKKIHVSDRGHFGMTRMEAQRYGYDAFGYVVESRNMGSLFSERLPCIDNLDLLCPALVQDVQFAQAGGQAHSSTVNIEINGKVQTLTAGLVVGADGGRSLVRQQAGVGAYSHDYQQTAIISNVTPEYVHQGIAYERFTDSGPLALLPMSDNRCSLVWTVARDHVDDIMALNDDAFLQQLNDRFGYRLGKFQQIGSRHAYPLHLVRADEHWQPGLALIGNAAHTLHPIAGQGFNLGVRDVATLAQVISDGLARGEAAGSAAVLARYEKWRQGDQRHITMLTDGLVRMFSNNSAPLVVARNLGLLALDILPPLKRRLARQTMGMAGTLPRLARGLPLIESL